MQITTSKKACKTFFNWIMFALILGSGGCKKLIEVSPPINSTNATNVFTDDATAASVLTGIFSNLSASNSGFGMDGFTSLSVFGGLVADELILHDISNTSYYYYYSNQLTSQNVFSYWSKIYPIIFVANSAIDGIEKSNSLTPSLKQQLLGEAKFIRAFCYFYLITLYGNVPIVVETDPKVNAQLFRSPESKVWQQIIIDLKEAQNLLSTNYLKSDALSTYTTNTTAERVRPTKWAATALLARAYLYTNDYANAESQASLVIDNSSMYTLPPLNSVFIKNSKEAIWQLQPIGTGVNANTGDGRIFILPSSGPAFNYPVYLSNNLVDTFEKDDQRKVSWIGIVTPASPGTTTYYYANKYKIGAINSPTVEYLMVLRLAEQYLIRAEARSQLNKIDAAKNDLNMIRSRALLPNTTANDKATLLNEILHERQVELFTEWGHRWLDIKRLKVVDEIMNIVCTQKGGVWNTNWQWFPIPLTDLQYGPNLEQNAGY